MKRTAQQNDVLIDGLTRRFERQKPAVDYMAEHFGAGPVADFGCGNGIPLAYLAQRHPDLFFAGVDHSTDILDRNLARSRPNVLLVAADLQSRTFPGESLGSAVFNRSLHEVYSLFGEVGLKLAVTAARDALRPGGHVLVYENAVPSRDRVALRIVTEEVRELFARFIRDYSIRPVPWTQKTSDTIVLQEDDALEFLTKYRDPDWESEMREVHFLYSLEEWDAVLTSCGLEKVAVRRFDDRQILATDGVEPGWDIADFKHVLVYRRPV
ncbi:methyltransferase domain-containing protein [Amycolatopsis balhimycina DSM 5908]|uniref:Methyltransferase domain-containing protein n=1 Tax=Amycolatopsis balhimycina DSM 5908 TaxID=1081091 RepID=A0A428X6F0_AMYBA|nr:methyltransferase domain-containing protein [Amycolatopsis balhimycina]RSM50886.1 methyltransferase domain-containing protein [Amycolatopsis balhimycina DSM 5908]